MLCAVLSCFSPVRLFETPWTVVAHQAPLSVGFSRQEHWSGLPYLLWGTFLTQGWDQIAQKSKLLKLDDGCVWSITVFSLLLYMLTIFQMKSLLKVYQSLNPHQKQSVFTVRLFSDKGPLPFQMCLSWSPWKFQLSLRAFTSVWASEQHLLWNSSAVPPTKLFNTKGKWKLEWWWVYPWDYSTKLGTDLIRRWLYCYLEKFFSLLSGIRDVIYSPGIERE